ncbi:MAG: 3-deoxy-D-manno-octulosonic acid transferase, partial [Glaciecola sp.]|nr:3-deoxy-D-manno-octulosonic acid transferase [Glaciecola sp.]
VLLVDAMGVLTPLYHCADIAFVGGSIADRGGHNALEPASMGVPVLMGTYIYNNPEICEALIQAGGLYIIKNETDAIEQCQRWLKQSEIAHQAGQKGLNVIEQNQGALGKTIDVIIK